MSVFTKGKLGWVAVAITLILVMAGAGAFYIFFYWVGTANYPNVIAMRKQYTDMARRVSGTEYSYRWLTTPYTVTIDKTLEDGSFVYRMYGKWDGFDLTEDGVAHVRDGRGERYGYGLNYKNLGEGKYEVAYYTEDGEFNKIKGIKQVIGIGQELSIGAGDIVEVMWNSKQTLAEIETKHKQVEAGVVNEGERAATIIWHPGR